MSSTNGLTKEVQEQILETVRKSQEAVVTCSPTEARPGLRFVCARLSWAVPVTAQHGRTTSAMPTTDPWKSQMEALGAFIRAQRKLADLSLRELAELTDVSNPYLSQLERGLHQPSVRVLKSIAKALNLSAETLLAQAGLLDDSGNGSANGGGSPPQVEVAIRADPDLS